jgi:alkaline phosphatase D
MTLLSRRVFLAGSAAVVVGACSGSDNAANTPTASTTTTPSPGSTTATTTPPTSIAPTSPPTTAAPSVEFETDPFTLGVAAGDPDDRSVVLWTRLAPDPLGGGGMDADDVDVAWELSSDEAFATIVASGIAVAEARYGHSVHVIAEPGAGDWFYRFSVGERISDVGKVRIAAANTTSARFVTASCQNYQQAYWSAHDDIAAAAPDFVVFLGDYIYEGAAADPAADESVVRTHGTPEPTELIGYRDRYALYRSQPELRASSAACAWFVIWDDHEVENNYAGLSPQDKAESDGFEDRRRAAFQAWWEHMPVRLAAPADNADFRIYRAATWGDLLGITLLDGRQYRSDQTCGDGALNLDPACPETFDATRTMLGAEQEAFVAASVGNQGTAWNVIGQQTVMLSLELGEAVLNYDQWDGYPAARARLTADLAARQVPNVIVLTGDLHIAGVGVVRDGEPGVGPIVATEFVATSISSNGNIDPALAPAVTGFLDVVDAELEHRGYILHTVTADEWQAEYRIVDDVKQPESPVSTFRTYLVRSGSSEILTQ